MRTRIFRTLSTTLSLLLLVAVPTQASPIKFADVINVMGDLQKGGQIQQLKLRAALQDPTTKTIASTSTSTASTVAPATDSDPLVAPGTQSVSPSLNAGTAVAPQQPQGDIQVFDQDSVDGTICDCGEIPPVGGGIPWWPFLALIPLICVTGVCSHDKRVPPPPVETPTPPIPEPTSLLLFGTGIVALTTGARRRYAKMRASKQAAAMTEV
jgi:PEP-CTERM motif